MWDYKDISKIKGLIEIGRYNEALQSLILYIRSLSHGSKEWFEAEILYIDLLIRAGYLSETRSKVETIQHLLETQGFTDKLFDIMLLRIQIDQQYGEYRQATQKLQQTKILLGTLKSQNVPDYEARQARITFYEGIQSWYTGDLEAAIEKLKEAKNVQDKLPSRSEYIRTLSNYGRMLIEKGDFYQGEAVLEEALQLERKVGNQASIATILGNIGKLNQLKGHLEEALQYTQESLLIWENLGDYSQIRFNLASMATIYRQKGDFQQALNYVQRGVAIAERIGNPAEISWFLFEIFNVYLEMGALENAQICVAKLYTFKSNTVNKKIGLRYRLAKALLLKRKGRAKDLFMAQDIFSQIADEPVVEHEITQIALLNLCELLLMELQLEDDTEIYQDLDAIITKLLAIAENQRSFLLLAETYLLKAKMALIKLDVGRARKFLNQAQSFAEESGLIRIAVKISEEHDKLVAQQKIWESFRENKAPFLQRAKAAGLEGIVKDIVQQKGIEPPVVQNDIPIALVVLNENGPIIYFKSFSTIWKFEQEMLGGFLVAFDSMSDEVFSQHLDRAKFGDFNVLVKKHAPFLIGYVYQGPSFYAQKKMLQFYNEITNNQQIMEAFMLYSTEKMVLSAILRNYLDIVCDQILLQELNLQNFLNSDIKKKSTQK